MLLINFKFQTNNIFEFKLKSFFIIQNRQLTCLYQCETKIDFIIVIENHYKTVCFLW